jgi:hypothetical protein
VGHEKRGRGGKVEAGREKVREGMKEMKIGCEEMEIGLKKAKFQGISGQG